MRHYNGKSPGGEHLWMESSRSPLDGAVRWFAVYDVPGKSEETLFDMMVYQQMMDQQYSLSAPQHMTGVKT